MKSLIRSYLVNLGALWVASQVLPALSINGGFKGLAIGAGAFMVANVLLVPLLKVLLLPLNLLTLGIFAWLSNVLALYCLVRIIPNFGLSTYHFAGISNGGFIVPAMELSEFQVAIVASFIIGFIIHFMHWLMK